MWQPQGFFNQYVLRTPVILCGSESVRGLFNYPATRIAIIHGGSFSDQELFASTFVKKSVHFFERSWKEEPDPSGIKETLGEIEEFRPDTIIAVGGGSVIDGAKLCRLFYEYPYYEMGETMIVGEFFRTHFIAIPTTIGSGAEVSSAAVYVNHATHNKDMVVMHELQPDVIVYDKRYVSNTPNRLLVASALDGMAHIIEGYVSNIGNSFADVMAEEGLLIFHSEFEKYLCGDKQEIDYERLQYAGYMGGIVQNHCIVGAAHAVAHQMTGYGYSHGEAVALLLSAVISLNSEDRATSQKYEKIAKKTAFYDMEGMIGFIRGLCDKTGISERRDELRGLICDLSKDEAFCENVRNDKGGKGNPVEITDEYIEKLSERI